MARTRINEDNILKVLLVGSILLSVLLAFSGALFFSIRTGLGIIAGACIAIINFVWQRSIMQRVLGLQTGRPVAYSTVRYLLRLSITAVLLYFILTSGYFSIPGLLTGLSVIVIMIVIGTVYFVIQHKGD